MQCVKVRHDVKCCNRKPVFAKLPHTHTLSNLLNSSYGQHMMLTYMSHTSLILKNKRFIPTVRIILNEHILSWIVADLHRYALLYVMTESVRCVFCKSNGFFLKSFFPRKLRTQYSHVKFTHAYRVNFVVGKTKTHKCHKLFYDTSFAYT